MKTINIKGKDYVTVAERLLHLKENYVYDIQTEPTFYPEQEMWVVKAILRIYDKEKKDVLIYTGLAQEIIGDGYINKTSALENCETSAVGRACAFAGIGIVDGVVSVDEINKAKTRETYKEDTRPWLSEKQLQQTVSRFVNDGEIDIIDKCRKTFRIREEYNKQLDSLIAGNPPVFTEDDPDAFEKLMDDENGED